jgi:predicted methyltransferase
MINEFHDPIPVITDLIRDFNFYQYEFKLKFF